MSAISNIRAMGPRILVRENNHASRQIGAIYVHRLEKDKLCSGEVLSIGRHPKVEALGLSVGETVWFKRECGVQAGADESLVFLLAEQLDGEGQAEAVSLTRRLGA